MYPVCAQGIVIMYCMFVCLLLCLAVSYILLSLTTDNRGGGGGIGNGNMFCMENSWQMRVLVYLCTARGCSDKAEIAANALEIIVVCIATHNSIKYDHFVVLTYKEFSSPITFATIMPIIVYLL